MHRAEPHFWRYFNELPESVQRLARQKFQLLNENPAHPSLRLKKIGRRHWSTRVGLGYRAVAIEDEEGFVWGWIGDHKDFDRLFGS